MVSEHCPESISMTHNLRASNRKICRSRAILIIEGVPSRVDMIDLSLGGISFHSRQPLPIGSTVQIGFTLFLSGIPKSVTAACQVRNIVLSGENYRVGASFAPLNDLSKQIIKEFLAAT